MHAARWSPPSRLPDDSTSEPAPDRACADSGDEEKFPLSFERGEGKGEGLVKS